jgi:molybdate/tungstate transport system substrate-binding protein
MSAFAAARGNIVPAQENSPSIEAVRKLTELGKVPDILAVADYNVIADLLMPGHAGWYVTFASNAMVLAYAPGSKTAEEINGDNWWRILLRRDVKWGMSNPALDPNGYRSLMVFQLAERHYGEPGLAGRLRAALDPRLIRPSEAQLLGLVQAGELDYAWSYRSLAATAGLKWVELPAAVNLSDPARAAEYGQVSVRVPGALLSSSDSLTFRGEPIVYALTIPLRAPHPGAARAFARFALSPAGRAIFERAGFRLLPKPILTGTGPGASGLIP